MSLPVTITLTKRNGELINSGLFDKVKMDTFLNSINEGDLVEVTYELKHQDGTNAQMKKLHASIRAIAAETGAEFEDMKLVVKTRAGLIVGDNIKSFADCSKDELSKCIQECIAVGDIVNVNLHG